MKQAKQLIKSKRMGFTVLLNYGWLMMMLGQLRELRMSAEALTAGYAWGEVFGIVVVIIGFIGMAWTKLHDDARNA